MFDDRYLSLMIIYDKIDQRRPVIFKQLLTSICFLTSFIGEMHIYQNLFTRSSERNGLINFLAGMIYRTGVDIEKILAFTTTPLRFTRSFRWSFSLVVVKGAQSRLNGLKSLAKLFKFVVCNPCQSSPFLTILVPLWFIIVSLMFFYLSKVYFQVSFNLTVILSMLKITKKYRD